MTVMKMNKVPFAKPVVDKEMLDAVSNALQNERLVGGESVHKFEEAFARYCGVKHAVSVSSGTNALQLAFIALGVKEKEVQTTPFSFIATANAVIEAGGRPTLFRCVGPGLQHGPNDYPEETDQEDHRPASGTSVRAAMPHAGDNGDCL